MKRAGFAARFSWSEAALALAYDLRRVTRDIDAVFEPRGEFREATASVAKEHGLPEDWINDAAKGYLHGVDPDAQAVVQLPRLRVDVASPRYLLAMKLLAAREEDVDDILRLYELCGFTTHGAGRA